MLVLSRKTDEQLLIGGNIIIRILDVKRGRVRLGIEAPKEVSIQRTQSPQAEMSEERQVCCAVG